VEEEVMVVVVRVGARVGGRVVEMVAAVRAEATAEEVWVGRCGWGRRW
jgi:hypothetical protein